MREKLIAEYHQMLAADESLTCEFFASLKEMMRARRLLYGGREIGVALRPHLLTHAQYDMLTRSSEVLAGAYNKVSAAFLTEPSRMKTSVATALECLVESGGNDPVAPLLGSVVKWSRQMVVISRPLCSQFSHSLDKPGEQRKDSEPRKGRKRFHVAWFSKRLARRRKEAKSPAIVMPSVS